MATTEDSIQKQDERDATSAVNRVDADLETQSEALDSHLADHVFENDRRYQNFKPGAYWGPNDQEAADNLDLYHHVFKLSYRGKLCLAPVPKTVKRALDLGTGTGRWAVDFAGEYPSATVVATDIPPLETSSLPVNVIFRQEDFCEPWATSHENYDFIHARCLYGSIPDYPALYGKALKALKPGGWFEQAEISVVAISDDGSVKGTYMDKWGALALELGEKTGKSFGIEQEMIPQIRGAGFVDVRSHTFNWPVGDWAEEERLKELGRQNRIGWEKGLGSWTNLLFPRVLGWSVQETRELCDNIRKDLRNPRIHAYQHMTVCYGRKPPSD